MTAGKKRALVTLPFELVQEVHQFRVKHRLRSESAALARLVEEGLDYFENRELYERLRHWGASIP